MPDLPDDVEYPLEAAAGTTKLVAVNASDVVVKNLTTALRDWLQSNFGAITATSINLGDTTLANYVKDTFTPTIVGTSTPGSGTYSQQQGQYTRIGNLVFFNVRLIWTAHDGSGNMRVSGLPITSAGNFEAVSIRGAGLTLSADNVLQGFVEGSQVRLKQYPAGGGNDSDVPLDTSATLHISGHYAV